MTGIIVRCEESDFIFRPQEDITAFELSQAFAYFILPALAVKSEILNTRKWVDLPDNVKKHFHEQKRESKKEQKGITDNILDFLTLKG